jgi:hypothetical protein
MRSRNAFLVLLLSIALEGCSSSRLSADESRRERWTDLYEQSLADKAELASFNKRFINEGARRCLLDEYAHALDTADEHLDAALAEAIQIAQERSGAASPPLRRTLRAYLELAGKYWYFGNRYGRVRELEKARAIKTKLQLAEQTARPASRIE